MKKIVIAFILLLDITLMCCCRGYSESVWQEKYDLGERYLQSGEGLSQILCKVENVL